jgi:hypothetical protein
VKAPWVHTSHPMTRLHLARHPAMPNIRTGIIRWKALGADIIGAFTTVYLTAMSIVQGVAFGYLMLRLYEDRTSLQFYEWF